MLVANTYQYSNYTEISYRIMTLKLTGPEVTALQFAVRREIDRLKEYIQALPEYSFRNQDIANMKMLKSLLADLQDHAIKP